MNTLRSRFLSLAAIICSLPAISQPTNDRGWYGIRIRILIHYPNQKADAYNANKIEGDNTAWNILVSPRYSNIQHLSERGLQGHHPSPS